jgi:hypothetical protein
MIYDNDLRTLRRITIGLNLMNAAAMGFNVSRHHWLFALTCAVWALCGFWQLTLVKVQQQWRDNLKITFAGLRAIEERAKR